LDNPVFASYAFYGASVVLKLVALGPLTSFHRVTKRVFACTEDTKAFGAKKIITDDPTVERLRRNHLNDLENIPAFLFLGLLYIATKPSLNVAVWHFRLFAVSRIIHTIAYQLALQPARVLAFGVGIAVIVSLGVQVILSV